MGAAAGPAAAITSMASVGLSASATMMKAQGTKAANDFQADELDRAAKYGDLKAVQTGAQMTQRLNQTLGNIDVIRAAGRTDPTSPTGVAYRDYQEDIGVTQRTTAVNSILAQSRQQESDAAYLRTAGQSALLAGKIGAFGQVLGAVGPALGKNFGLPGGSKKDPIYAPDDI